MGLASDGKITENGTIYSNEMITEVEGYKAMLIMLEAYWLATNSNDLTDILSGGKLWNDKPMDTAYWEYWLEAVEKARNR